MAGKPVNWIVAERKYRYVESGRAVSAKQVQAIRDQFIDRIKASTADLAAQLASGDLTSAAFETAMRDRIKQSFIGEYMLGRGGKEVMTQRDYGALGAELKKQYQFLRTFVQDITNGTQSQAQVAARSEMYIESSRKAHERGKSEAWGIAGQLPGFPTVGSTCRQNCRCSWVITETDTEIHATWELGGGDPCPECAQRAADWSLIVIAKPEAAASEAA